MHGGQPLLAVENNVGRVGIALETVDRFARQRLEVRRRGLPEKKAPDVVIAEDRTHELVDVPGLPLELALKIGNHVAAFAEAVDQGREAHAIRLLNVLHRLSILPCRAKVGSST